jgi:hypothetical protein
MLTHKNHPARNAFLTPVFLFWFAGAMLSLPQSVSAQSNDNFANRIVLSGPSWATTPVAIANATVEPREPIYQGRPSIWYSWTAPSDLLATISTVGSDSTPTVTVSVGSSLTAIYAVTQGGSLSGLRKPVTFSAVKGVTYQIAVEATSGNSSGNATLSLTSTALGAGATIIGPDLPSTTAPANDSFSNRKVLTGLPISIVAYTGGATRETQEPVSTTLSTVWYSYTATDDGFLNVSMDAVSDGQSKILIFNGDTFDTMQTLAVISGAGTANGASLLMQKGATYHLQVGNGYNSSGGVGNIIQAALSFTPNSSGATLIGPDKPIAGGIPANNNFAQRKTVSGSALRVFSYNTNADQEAFEPAGNPLASVWYSWGTDQSGTATITVGGLNTIAESLTIWTGSNLNALSRVTLTAVSSVNGRYTFPVAAGTTYQIAMGSNFGTAGGLINFDLAGPGAGTVSGGGATPSVGSRLINIATRAVVGPGGNLNPGFVISGTGKKTILVRAIGPALANFGVPNTMSDPRVAVFAGSTQIGGNDNWSANATEAAALRAAFSATGAFALPDGSRDAALLLTLDPGTYTALVTGAGGGGGDAIVEIYEVP